MNNAPDQKPAQKTTKFVDHFWAMRFLDGMNFGAWVRLLVRNRFAVAPRRIGMALIVTSVTLMNSVLWFVQHLVYGRRLARTRIEHAPIFILGHWRSGTTLLHELLVSDPRHTFPTSFQCFSPNHFLISSWLFRRCLWFLLPAQRPMDNMPLGFDRPQEDEFALCNLGAGSPYTTIAFANRPIQDQEYLDFEGVSAHALDRWKRIFVWFLKCVTLRDPRRIVLKSPPHTGRIRVLLELFPEARFVHIVRDPYVLFPSTQNMWRRMYRRDGLQKPHYRDLEERIFKTFDRMYAAFERDRPLIGPGRYCEVRYEDLVADPIGQMRKIYDGLELGEFDGALPALETYVAGQKGYKTNRYEISPELRDQITRRWSSFIERYGYGAERAEA